MSKLEKTRLQQFMDKNLIEAGCDEAGRGCLAGPVFAAAVILPVDFYHPLLNDSKQLSATQRDKLRPIIEEKSISFGVCAVDAKEIDEINILQASITGMHRALAKLSVRPQHILVDGNKFRQYEDIPHTCVVKGDSKYASIAAASILAKTYRDEYMKDLAKQFPNYGWDKNMAYPTKAHRDAIKQYGVTLHHRLTFNM